MSQLTPVHDKHDHDHEKHDHEGHDHKDHDHSQHDHAQAEQGHGSCCSSKVAPAVVTFTGAPASGGQLSTFRIEQMDCPTEQTLIQNKLGKLAGVQKLEFNLINRMLGVWHELPSTDPIREAIASLGMQAEPIEEGAESTPAPVVKKAWWPLALSGVTALAAEIRLICVGLGSRHCGAGFYPQWRFGYLQKRLDRTQEPQPEHQRFDEYCRNGRSADRAMAGSSDGDVPVHRRGAD